MKKNRLISVAAVAVAAALAAAAMTACSSGRKKKKPNISGYIWEQSSESDSTSEKVESSVPDKVDNGLAVKDGKGYFYIDGELQKNGIVGNDSEGYYYADEDGAIDLGYCDGINVDGEDWIITEGKATRVVSDSDATLYRAAKAIAECTDSSMSREEKLRAAFDYIKTAYLEGVPHDPPYHEMDWPVVCANDLLVDGMGDCYSYGAAFTYYAKAIGYEETYACNSGGHGWAEIEGKYYDPEWDMHHNEYNHFGVAPDDDCDVKYARALKPDVVWMRIKV